MPFAVINSIVSWFFKKRITQVKYFQKYPIKVQENVLSKLIQKAEKTRLGEKWNFASILSHDDFVKNVPIQQYESIEKLIHLNRQGEQNIFWSSHIKWFAKSSGTTNAKSKFIPVSTEAIENCHFKAGKDMLCLFFNNNPNANLFTGKSLILGGSSNIYEKNSTYFGDLSAIIIENLPFWADFSSAPSQQVALMDDWETKIDSIVNSTVDENITSLTGVPSWMLVVLNRILEKTGKQNILEVWPNLEVYFHGGVNFNPYREQYKKLIPSDSFKYFETYNASEGFFAIQDKNDSEELLLMLDYGIYYEFIPMEYFQGESSITIPLKEVEIGKNYALVITTNSGLWRYLIGDTVKFTCLDPYRIKITGRTKHFINVFGEELIIENTEQALKKACHITKATVWDYTVGPIFMKDKNKGAHQWIIEFKKEPNCLTSFTKTLDLELQNLNSDYQAKRYLNMTLNPPVIHKGEKGLFYQWLKSKGKLGGQHKVPRLSNQRVFIDELLAISKKIKAHL